MSFVQTVSGRILPVSKAYDEIRDTPASIDVCPVNGHGYPFKMRRWTLERMLAGYHYDKIRDEGYRFCEDPECPIVYFHNSEGFLFALEDVQVPVGIKTKRAPIPVCYCKKVDEQTILNEIVVKQCCTSLLDIKAYTKARTGTECHIRNPSGRCCGDHIQRVIDKGLAMTQDDDLKVQMLDVRANVPVDDSCCSINKEIGNGD